VLSLDVDRSVLFVFPAGLFFGGFNDFATETKDCDEEIETLSSSSSLIVYTFGGEVSFSANNAGGSIVCFWGTGWGPPLATADNAGVSFVKLSPATISL
jgi:hypothetical protein